jgi:hypothetical protein
MTGYIQRFFWWCVGADDEVLRDCPKSERIKHASYGNLILVPAILGLISMSFAISTVNGDRRIYLTIGIVWALIVFAFDRAIVSSFRKGNTILNDLFSSSFLARLILAAVVGFVIAHPLVMFYFNASVEGQLDNRRRTEIQKINTNYDNQIRPLEDQKTTLDRAIADIRTRKDEDVKQRESDLLRIMGARRSRRRTGELRNIRKRLLAERDTNINNINTQKTPIDDRIVELKKAREADLLHYTQPRDYLARENALSDLIEESSVVRWTQRLIIFLFVFVDILPITLKVTTKKGSYDSGLESSNNRATNESKMEEELHGEELGQVKEHHKQKIKEVIEAKYKSPAFLTALENDIEAIINRLLGRHGRRVEAAEPAAAAPSQARTDVPAESGSTGKKKWSARVKEKLEEKGVDAVISLICIPIEVGLLFIFYLYGISDVWQYVAKDTIMQVFALLLVNVLLSQVIKLKKD